MIKIQVQYRDMAEKDCGSWRWLQNEHSNHLPVEKILESVFGQWQHGSGDESELFLKKRVRSMMVGDYIQVSDVWYEVLDSGWRVDVPWEEMFFEKSKEDFSYDQPPLVAWAHKILHTTIRDRNKQKGNDEISLAE